MASFRSRQCCRRWEVAGLCVGIGLLLVAVDTLCNIGGIVAVIDMRLVVLQASQIHYMYVWCTVDKSRIKLKNVRYLLPDRRYLEHVAKVLGDLLK